MTISSFEERQMKAAARSFWQRVDDPDDNGCRQWVGPVAKYAGGHTYGKVSVNIQDHQGVYRGRKWPAHRLAWKLRYGRWPIYDLKNQCGNTLCMEPSHWTAKSTGATAAARRKASPYYEEDPWLPTAPLLAYIDNRGGVAGIASGREWDGDAFQELEDRVKGMRHSEKQHLSFIDDFCCKILNIHPVLIYGDAYWELTLVEAA